METPKILGFFFIATSLYISIITPTLAYEPRTTHAALTQEIIKLFNYHSNKRIDSQDIETIIQGSIDEDANVRPLHHFYDPIHNKGLTLLEGDVMNYPTLAAVSIPFGSGWSSSKDWASSSGEQQSFSESLSAGLLNSYFSGKDDYSWERAIYEYTWGDKKRGLESLGHILHLIEDASVPDHTRNDPHPPFADSLFHQESPYESWTNKFDRSTINTAEEIGAKRSFYEFASLGEFFNNIALYSNKNFFSKDSILDKNYQRPLIEKKSQLKLSDGVIYNFGITNDTLPIVLISETLDHESGELTTTYSLNDKDNLILKSYWQNLSREAVLNGAGVVKLFFDEVEKERRTKVLYEKNRSWFSKKIDATKDSIFSLAGLLYGSSVKNSDLEDTPAPAEVAPPAQLAKREIVTVKKVPPAPGPKIIPLPKESPAIFATPKLVDIPVDKPSLVTSPPPLGYFISGGGGPLPETNNTDSSQTNTTATGNNSNNSQTLTSQSTAATSDITPPAAPVINSPSSGSSTTTASLTFSGTAESGASISVSSFSTTTTTDASGTWALPLSLPQGTSTLSFYATDAAGNISTTATSSIYVDSIAPDVSLSVPACSNTIATTGCLLMSTSISLNWSSASSDTVSYEVTCETSGAACSGFSYNPTGTSTAFIASDDSQYTLRARAVDASGNRSGAAETIVRISTRPLVINEIAWAGTSATRSEDEWLELYNRSGSPISLTGWTLYSETDLKPYINLTGSIAADSYFLIERTDDTATSIPANIVTSFGSGAGRGLANNGEVLVLSFASTTIDRTPSILCNGTWCGGDTNNYLTMERYDPDASGTLTSNWGSNNQFIKSGTNADGIAIQGTPKSRNSLNHSITLSQDSTIISSRTLTRAKSPYLIWNDVTVNPTATLTIEPGVVIKNTGRSLSIDGVLNANGTAENPIVFTSIHDDTYGGDLNGNGSATSPAAGQWTRITLTKEGSLLNNVKLRYGGSFGNDIPDARAMLYVNNVSANITNSVIEYSRNIGLSLHNSSSTVDSNIIQNNAGPSGSGLDPVGIKLSGGAPQISSNTIQNNLLGIEITEGTATIQNNTFNSNTGNAVTIANDARSTFSGNIASGNGMNGISMSGTLPITATLSANLPYTGELSVPAGRDLIISAGSIFKNFLLDVAGTLDIEGTSGSPVVFTALNDDSYGGDTNNNGDMSSLCAANPLNSSCPQPGAWNRVSVSGATATSTIRHAIFRYGGSLAPFGALYLSGTRADISDLTIENSLHNGLNIQNGSVVTLSGGTIRNNQIGIDSELSSLTIAGTQFRNNTIGLIVTGGQLIDNGSNSLDTSNTTRSVPAGLLP